MNKNEIAIEDIEVVQNTRTELGDLSELMSSIRENGLLQPIGVWKETSGKFVVAYGHRRFAAMQKLGRKSLLVNKEILVLPKPMNPTDFMILNISENIHRSDNTPVELGRACKQLQELGLTISEIAIRLGVSISKVKGAIDIINNVPNEYYGSIGYFKNAHEVKKGKISVSVANKIATNVMLSKDEIKDLFKETKKNELGIAEIEVISRMMKNGLTIKEALKARKEYKATGVELIVNQKEAAKLNINLSSYVSKIIKGEEKPNPKLLY